eukprot:maker-scaffold_36-snap-gene-2.6-mRNA-1 protein AED:0.02 eAED:0.02 QI:93/0.5/0.66/1/0.5/0.33/3/104/273
MLYFIGLGLGDEKDITVKGLEIVRSCEKIYLEHYTAILGVDKEKLEKFYEKEIVLADRTMVEEGSDVFLDQAKNENVAFLVVGDPFWYNFFFATTHSDLFLRAKEKEVEIKVIHNASIMNAIGCTGLQLYNFGQTVSIPWFLENWKPVSWYDKIKQNIDQKLHTLCLLDIKVKEPNVEKLETTGKIVFDPPRFMSCAIAAEQLLYAENEKKEKILSEDTMVVGVARVGLDDQKLLFCTLGEMKNKDLGKPLHSLIIPSELHPLEIDMLNLFRE